MNVYPFIEAENASTTGNVTRSCELLQVSRAAYYAHRTAIPSARTQQDAELTEEITAIHNESNGTYGTPRIHAELRARGRRVARKRVARLLRAAGLAGRTPKRWRTTTVPDPAASTPTDLIERDFACRAAEINTRWCGDITCAPTLRNQVIYDQFQHNRNPFIDHPGGPPLSTDSRHTLGTSQECASKTTECGFRLARRSDNMWTQRLVQPVNRMAACTTTRGSDPPTAPEK